MNIVYIHTHDTGRYIEPYGYNIPTPNLMKLAKEGVLFRSAYCTGPTCSPSRAGLLTGTSPHSCGMIGLANRGFRMNDYNKHLVRFLNERGFETVLCGIQHEAPDNNMIGYQKIFGNQNDDGKNRRKYDLTNAKAACQYLEEKKSAPFFLSFGLSCTHREYSENDEDVNPNYVKTPSPIADTPENRKDMSAFISAVKYADGCIGMVLDALKHAGLENDTFIIFTTDHGIAFPRMKCTLYDTGIGVSLIIKYPGNKREGEAVDALVSQIDIFPTLCDVLGIDTPFWLQGKSLLPILRKESDEVNNEIFSEITFHATYEPMRCIRTKRYKFIKYFDVCEDMFSTHTDASVSKEFMLTNGFYNLSREKEMLFDLYLDPFEYRNLVADSDYCKAYNELSSKLSRWMKDTKDPLLLGKVEVPEGVRVDCKNLSGINKV